ncbi:hypothetical protein CS022_21390 [Veronia nyctiphanis]|uniref:Uncharacterized protein n=1 Tax=Veronia nyctiphanis TaxID=1278244 RepID=A0A4Q0YPX0_9GAMM|nr:hypothetical protein [Veronia nyctiphanis]RXJ71219.1 hypothetical protein CS022_21390 [Veronia nyctiphanis]
MLTIYAYSQTTNQLENDEHIQDLLSRRNNLYVVGGCHGDENGKPIGNDRDGYIFAEGDQRTRATGSGVDYHYKNLSGQTSSGYISDENEKSLAKLVADMTQNYSVLLCWCHSYTWIKNYIENDPILSNQRITIQDVSGTHNIG